MDILESCINYLTDRNIPVTSNNKGAYFEFEGISFYLVYPFEGGQVVQIFACDVLKLNKRNRSKALWEINKLNCDMNYADIKIGIMDFYVLVFSEAVISEESDIGKLSTLTVSMHKATTEIRKQMKRRRGKKRRLIKE
ncbi:hypothetical protein [Dysgonomonas capnocytophagoides]|uniref:hypothetical protein n=1 Tax=Dysgonomonas capnocytophagoides TaxID=45254 RepID=UPI003995603F